MLKKKRILSALIALNLVCMSIGFAEPFTKSDKERAIEQNVQNGTNPDSLAPNPINPPSSSNSNNSKEPEKGSLESENTTLYQLALQKYQRQQENLTSTDDQSAYNITDDKGNPITVYKNRCYLKQTTECQQNITIQKYGNNGVSQNYTLPLNQLEYISGSTEITSEMRDKIKSQETLLNTMNNGSSSGNVIDSTIRNMLPEIASMKNISTAEKMNMLAMAFLQAQNQQEQLDKDKEIATARKTAMQYLTNQANTRASIAQTKRGTLQQDERSKELYTVVIEPTIPTVENKDPIYAVLKTKSGKLNNPDVYQIIAQIKDPETGKMYKMDVFENAKFAIEKANPNRKPGTRTVTIVYKYRNNPEEVNTSFSYTVGQMSTGILPDGKNVSNSVSAIASNADVLNYNNTTQAVSGRIIDSEWSEENQTCFVHLTDSKTDSGNYPEITLNTNGRISKADCLSGKYNNSYAIIPEASASLDANGRYVFADKSNGVSQYGATESEYDTNEDTVAAETQNKQQGWDNPAIKVDPKTGYIYSTLPGQAGIDYVYLPSLGSFVAIGKDGDGNASFRKADGTAYTEDELKAKGINDISQYDLKTDENGIYYVTDKAGNVLSKPLSPENIANIGMKSRTLENSVDASNLNQYAKSNGIGVFMGNVLKGTVHAAKNISETVKNNTGTIGAGTYVGMAGELATSSQHMIQENQQRNAEAATEACSHAKYSDCYSKVKKYLDAKITNGNNIEETL